MIVGATTLVKAIKDYFGIPADKAINEIKPLTDKDKTEMAAMLRNEGYEITPDEKGRW